MKKKNDKKLKTLFFTLLYISAFTFGGGFVIVTFMKQKFVDELGWMKEEEMLDLAAIAQSTPGAIAVNAAILVGWKVAGFFGVLVSVIATILPPFLILVLVSFFYEAFSTNYYISLLLEGMQIGVAAIILNMALDLGKHIVLQKNLWMILTMILSFVAAHLFHINVIYVILTVTLFAIAYSLKELYGKWSDI